MSSHCDALRAPAATRLHHVDLGTGRVDAKAESGKLAIPEDGVLVIDRETVDDPFGERAITAVAGEADLLVSGDKGDMLALGNVEGIPIVTAREAIGRLRRRMAG